MRTIPVTAALLAAALAGCISVGGGGEPVERRAYDLQPGLPTDPAMAGGPEVLWVEPFTIDRALDRDEIVWRRGGVESGAYGNHRWARPPAEAVRAVLADALARSGACAVVATDPRAERPDYLLRGHLVRCEEADEGEAWSGVLEVRVVVVRVRDGEEVLRRTYGRSEKAKARNPEGVVRALKAALDAVAAECAADLDQILETERAEPTVR